MACPTTGDPGQGEEAGRLGAASLGWPDQRAKRGLREARALVLLVMTRAQRWGEDAPQALAAWVS
jgi:hypothetical protein